VHVPPGAGHACGSPFSMKLPPGTNGRRTLGGVGTLGTDGSLGLNIEQAEVARSKANIFMHTVSYTSTSFAIGAG
jgi:hypothetical protein